MGFKPPTSSLPSAAVTGTITAGDNITSDANLRWKSGTANTATLDHAISADRTYTYPDADGNVPLMGFANTGSLSASTTIHAGSDIDTDANVKFKSGTSFTLTLDHAIGADRTVTFQDAAGTVALTSQIPASFGITLGDASSATVLTAGTKAYIAYFPYAMTITGWYIFGSPSGSIVIDVWKKAAGAGVPTVADTIAGSEKPTLSGAQQNSDTSLGTWTTSVAAGDVIAFNVDSVATCTFCNLVIVGTRV